MKHLFCNFACVRLFNMAIAHIAHQCECQTLFHSTLHQQWGDGSESFFFVTFPNCSRGSLVLLLARQHATFYTRFAHQWRWLWIFLSALSLRSRDSDECASLLLDACLLAVRACRTLTDPLVCIAIRALCLSRTVVVAMRRLTRLCRVRASARSFVVVRRV